MRRRGAFRLFPERCHSQVVIPSVIVVCLRMLGVYGEAALPSPEPSWAPLLFERSVNRRRDL
jgi:hypothetical protein